MEIIYSDHAIKRMKQRGIEDWEIEKIVKFPAFIKKVNDKIESVGESRNRKVKIVYRKEQSYIKIITVI